jgi:hypothetical protein
MATTTPPSARTPLEPPSATTKQQRMTKHELTRQIASADAGITGGQAAGELPTRRASRPPAELSVVTGARTVRAPICDDVSLACIARTGLGL